MKASSFKAHIYIFVMVTLLSQSIIAIALYRNISQVYKLSNRVDREKYLLLALFEDQKYIIKTINSGNCEKIWNKFPNLPWGWEIEKKVYNANSRVGFEELISLSNTLSLDKFTPVPQKNNVTGDSILIDTTLSNQFLKSGSIILLERKKGEYKLSCYFLKY